MEKLKQEILDIGIAYGVDVSGWLIGIQDQEYLEQLRINLDVLKDPESYIEKLFNQKVNNGVQFVNVLEVGDNKLFLTGDTTKVKVSWNKYLIGKLQDIDFQNNFVEFDFSKDKTFKEKKKDILKTSEVTRINFYKLKIWNPEISRFQKVKSAFSGVKMGNLIFRPDEYCWLTSGAIKQKALFYGIGRGPDYARFKVLDKNVWKPKLIHLEDLSKMTLEKMTD